MKPLNIEKELNDEQQAAVLAPDGPVLIIAAAGTGKTRTLTYRVAHLVQQGVPAHRILLLTFTNKAAKEMMERARSLVGGAISGLWGGTFHGVANRLMRAHAERLGYQPNHAVLDTDDAQRIIKSCIDELNLKSKHFPKPAVLHNLFSLAINKSKTVEELAISRFACHDISIESVLEVHRLFKERKLELNGMDFDDMLVNALTLFKEHKDIREHYQELFLHVLVDEFQDTNSIQGEWVDILSAKHRNLLVVGDDFQSIYSWRGANFKNIINFPDHYPDAHVYKLETNYRSTPDILDIANKCIEGNPEQFQKTLRAIRKPHEKPRLIHSRTGPEQARYIIDQIRRLLLQGYKPGDIAILYRAHFHAMELQLELNRVGINYVITSGTRFFEQVHIKDVCAIARLAGNAHDELSFRRLLGFLPGVGPKTCARLWLKLRKQFNVWDPDQLNTLRSALPKKAIDIWNEIQRVFEVLVETEVEAKPNLILEQFMDCFYDEYAVENFDNYDNRREDINGMIDFAAKYTSLQKFLQEMALQTNLDNEAHQKDNSDKNEKLRLTTVHQAKGLEWPVVFILWLAEGMFPGSRSMETPGGEAEERRLFYVAATRAKDELYLCSPQTRRSRDGQLSYCMPSRFINEIPESMMRQSL